MLIILAKNIERPISTYIKFRNPPVFVLYYDTPPTLSLTFDGLLSIDLSLSISELTYLLLSAFSASIIIKYHNY